MQVNITRQIEIELKRYLYAFNDRKWEEFSSHIDDDFKYFTDRCVIQNKEQFISYLSKNTWDGRGYNISDLNVISSENEDLAVARYKAEFIGYENDKKITVYAIETTIFAKGKSGWKIVHSHTSNKI